MLIAMVILVFIILLIAVALVAAGHKSQKMEPDLGLIDNRLKDCGSKPNCVSSTATQASHHIDAIAVSADFELDQWVNSLVDNHGYILQTIDGNYAHLQTKSALFGFVDDIEFLHRGHLLDVRSGSRVGRSDLGVNRNRVEALRLLLKE